MGSPPQGYIANQVAVGGTQLALDSGGNLALFNSTGTEILRILNSSAALETDAGGLRMTAAGQITIYRGIGTAGIGIPAEYGAHSSVGNAALVTNAINYTPPATAGRYRINAFVNVRTAAAVNMAVTVGYTDAASVARSEAMSLAQQGATTIVNNMNNVAARFTGSYEFQIDNSATAITLSTTGTTMTLYDLAATLEQLA